MQPTLRVLIWLLAVVFAASPVLLAVISSPSHQGDLFVGASYASYSRDVAFILVSVISIGMIGALEVLATYFGRMSRPGVGDRLHPAPDGAGHLGFAGRPYDGSGPA